MRLTKSRVIICVRGVKNGNTKGKHITENFHAKLTPEEKARLKRIADEYDDGDMTQFLRRVIREEWQRLKRRQRREKGEDSDG